MGGQEKKIKITAGRTVFNFPFKTSGFALIFALWVKKQYFVDIFLKVASLARSVLKPLKVPGLARSVIVNDETNWNEMMKQILGFWFLWNFYMF